MMTDWNLSKTGFTAREASRQQSCSKGSFTPETMLPYRSAMVTVEWNKMKKHYKDVND